MGDKEDSSDLSFQGHKMCVTRRRRGSEDLRMVYERNIMNGVPTC